MRPSIALAFAFAASAAPLAAQTAHPDFSGKWTLDPKSVEGPMAPTSATMAVAQDAKVLKVDQTVSTQMGDQKSILAFNLDGSPSKNNVAAQGMSVDLASTAAWDGSALVVKTTADIQGQTMVSTDRWTLDANGTTLRIQRDVGVAGQSMSMTMVFNKQ